MSSLMEQCHVTISSFAGEYFVTTLVMTFTYVLNPNRKVVCAVAAAHKLFYPAINIIVVGS